MIIPPSTPFPPRLAPQSRRFVWSESPRIRLSGTSAWEGLASWAKQRFHLLVTYLWCVSCCFSFWKWWNGALWLLEIGYDAERIRARMVEESLSFYHCCLNSVASVSSRPLSQIQALNHPFLLKKNDFYEGPRKSRSANQRSFLSAKLSLPRPTSSFLVASLLTSCVKLVTSSVKSERTILHIFTQSVAPASGAKKLRAGCSAKERVLESSVEKSCTWIYSWSFCDILSALASCSPVWKWTGAKGGMTSLAQILLVQLLMYPYPWRPTEHLHTSEITGHVSAEIGSTFH